MSQAMLSQGPYRNSNLFSGYYLDEHVYELDAWDCDAEAREAFEALSDLYETRKDALSSYDEAPLRNHWIDKVLEELGYETLEETPLVDARGSIDRTLYDTEDDQMAAAVMKADGEHTGMYGQSLSILEAKQWDVDFTERFSEQRSYLDASHQIKSYLEHTPESVSWGILTNGKKWRLYGTKDYETETYYEVDLPELLESGSVEVFKYFHVFFRPAAFRESAGTTLLDTVWSESEIAAQELGEDLQDNVFTALRVLGEGFVETNDLEIDPADDERLAELKEQSLVLLYRLIFVLYAESRDLIDPEDPNRRSEYEENFSLGVLRHDIREEVGETPAESAFEREFSEYSFSMWNRLERLFSLVDTGNDDLGIPPYNGGLFDEERHEFLTEYEVANTYIAEVIYRLSTTETDEGFVPADYADLDTRHLGTIYEGLLEHEFAVAPKAQAAVAENGGEVWKSAEEVSVAEAVEAVEKGELYVVNDDGERKATGAYYTPDYVVTYIVEETVGPLLSDIEAELAEMDVEPGTQEYVVAFWDRVTDLKILDPAMGSGHFLTKATGYLADVVMEQVRELETGTLFNEEQVRREISKECIYGVDINGMAVELAKLSMWLETLAADQPLAFLDHHLKAGNSLVGSDITEVLSNGESEDGQITLTEAFARTRKHALEHVMDRVSELLAIDNETLDDIHSMEEIYEEIRDDPLYGRLFAMATVHTAAQFGLSVPTDATERMARAIEDPAEWAEIEETDWFRAAQAMGGEEGFFHWELEFPEVFFDRDGERMASAGFDAVVGNPPYGANFTHREQEYLDKSYTTRGVEFDSYSFFLEMAIGQSRRFGKLGYIVPTMWTKLENNKSLREYIIQNTDVDQIIECGKVFKSGGNQPIVDTLIIIATKGRSQTATTVRTIDLDGSVEDRLERLGNQNWEIDYEIESEELARKDDFRIDIFRDPLQTALIDKIETQSVPLDSVSEIGQGITAYDRRAGQSDEIVENRVYHSDRKEDETYGRWLSGRDISRYELNWSDEWLSYGDWLVFPRDKRLFTEPRLLFREVTGGSDRIIATHTDELYYYGHSIVPAVVESESMSHTLLSIVNSKLLSYYHWMESPNAQKDVFPKMNPSDVENIPIKSDISQNDREKLRDNAEKLSELKSSRSAVNLDLLDYFGTYEDGPTLGEMGYQPPSGLSSSVLTETAASTDFETLRVTAARVERNGGDVRVLAVPYVKPTDEAEYETNSRGYATLEPVPAMEFAGLDDAQAALIEAFVPYAVDEAGGFAGYRDNATATISPFDRLESLTLPVLADVENGIERYVERRERAAELDEQIERTDELIDAIVYELYELTDEEIEIVEEAVGS